jgi:SAM-dependent methyltransferase
MDDYKRANLALWNEWTEIHAKSEFYDLEGFKAGNTSLNAFEIEELGEVAGKSLLHLQCHFGLDTMSWARLGAKATGVDFSDQAIELANSINDELELDANFICSDIYELPDVLSGRFDIVYTSNGILAWLPDLKSWAKVIARFLKPGGTFYMAEFHPFAYVFDDRDEATELRVHYPYFHPQEPLVIDVEGTYADRSAAVSQPVSYEWDHSLSEVLNALISVGLRIESINEYPFSLYPMFPSLMEKGADGLWRLKESDGAIPLMFSLKATPPGGKRPA